ncbi:putative ketoacyl reductase [compost metagenome]
MIQAGYGRILNMASTAAFQPGPLMSNYYAGKSFVLSFTEAISIELNGTGVTAMALCPGPTKTGFEDRAELGNSKLFTTLKVANSKKVAEFGYRKLMKGKTVAVHGLQNKLLVIGTKIASRSLIRNVMYHIQKESNG